MFRSITSVGRTALRTGAISRQVVASNQQPSLFNALRAFSDDAGGRTKGTVKWFGTSRSHCLLFLATTAYLHIISLPLLVQ